VESSWPDLARSILDVLANAKSSPAWVIRPMALADMAAPPDERYADGFEIVTMTDVSGILRPDGFQPANGVTWRMLALDGRQIVMRVVSHLKAVIGDLDLVACYQDLEAEYGDDQEATVEQPERRAAPKLAGDLPRRRRKAAVETV
jgi:hypothetical protein